ncbi:MAG: [FeFe] hydrogenase, group A [Candidatus Woesearchaeota archaeon]
MDPEKTIEVNGREIKTKQKYLLQALEEAGYNIPKLCSHPDFEPLANCRLCIVEVDGRIRTSCNTIVEDGMTVNIDTPAVIEERRHNLELILSNHPLDCDYCYKNMRCELQALAERITKTTRYVGLQRRTGVDESSASIVRNMDQCILCGRCILACQRAGVSLLDYVGRGFSTAILPPFRLKLSETTCTSCGQCSLVCPTAAITEKDDRALAYSLINDKDKFVIAQIAPAVRVSIGEEFGLKPGTIVTGKLVAALKEVGFDAVCDTSLGADFTIVEEAAELISRLKARQNGERAALPMFTSCCPSWVFYVEEFLPELIPNLSTTKSPHEIMATLLKTYYSEKKKIPIEKISVVSIMPCTSKKEEARRVEHRIMGFPAVDTVLTVREASKMIREAGINLPNLQDAEFDDLLRDASGAGQIFGASGGVMEAVLRTASSILNHENSNSKIEFKEVRGLSGVKEAEYELGRERLRVAVVNGLGKINSILEKAGKGELDFIEVMACPGGCSGGGGQPIPTTSHIVSERIKGLYSADERAQFRESFHNPIVQKVYSEFLECPNSSTAENLLHTRFIPRKPYGNI